MDIAGHRLEGRSTASQGMRRWFSDVDRRRWLSWPWIRILHEMTGHMLPLFAETPAYVLAATYHGSGFVRFGCHTRFYHQFSLAKVRAVTSSVRDFGGVDDLLLSSNNPRSIYKRM